MVVVTNEESWKRRRADRERCERKKDSKRERERKREREKETERALREGGRKERDR